MNNVTTNVLINFRKEKRQKENSLGGFAINRGTEYTVHGKIDRKQYYKSITVN